MHLYEIFWNGLYQRTLRADSSEQAITKAVTSLRKLSPAGLTAKAI